MHFAARYGNTRQVEELLAAGADVGARDECATGGGFRDLCKAVLENVTLHEKYKEIPF